MELALRSVRKRHQEAAERHREAMGSHKAAMLNYERALEHWKSQRGDDPPPIMPDAVTANRCWTDDATTEALAILLKENPRGLLMIRDELAGWFHFDRYAQGKGGDAARWLEMFGGRPMAVDRKTGGSIYVPCAAVSIAGAIQPEILRRALGREHRDNGLAARLLFAMPPRKPKEWVETSVSGRTTIAVEDVFERLFGLTPDTDASGNSVPRLVTLDANAKKEWVQFYNAHALEQMTLAGDESAAWSKLEGYAARLALVTHLARWAAGERTLSGPVLADEDSIRAGVALAKWFGKEALRVYAKLESSGSSGGVRFTKGGQRVTQLIKFIKARGGTVTPRDVAHHCGPYLNQTKLATEALEGLVEQGLGRWYYPGPGPQGGRPPKRFELFGPLDETPSSTPENGGFGCGRDSSRAEGPGNDMELLPLRSSSH